MVSTIVYKPQDVIAQALAHEAHVSVLINDMYRITVKYEDHATQVMLL